MLYNAKKVENTMLFAFNILIRFPDHIFGTINLSDFTAIFSYFS